MTDEQKRYSVIFLIESLNYRENLGLLFENFDLDNFADYLLKDKIKLCVDLNTALEFNIRDEGGNNLGVKYIDRVDFFNLFNKEN